MIDLTPQRWSRVEELYHSAAGFGLSGRIDFVRDKCSDDPELCDYILSLLQGPQQIDATIEVTIAETLGHVFGDADSMQGEKIGPYRVERLIGSGGMGMVYLASRADEQYDQQVAIKLGRHRLVDPQTELRLRNERQILADLDHPCIARLLDGGTTDDGVPYLVMEYIDGLRIDTYCDANRLSIADRLDLFQRICSAVDYAHRNLVIHRDIKPSNILVAADGTPKLLDFGIAKLTDPRGAATDGLTREGAVVLTPANASPEQILGQAVTTSTDVYALGLLLYRLLSGFKAYETEGLVPSEFARIVCQEPAVAPSVTLERALQAERRSAEEISANRDTTPDRLLRNLRGDLDTIVLNALRKNVERRYRSVSALADDIGLHLRSMPIVARADSWSYRAAKFVRRHYAAVSVAVLIVAMLATFTVMLSIQNRLVVRERDTAREVSQFLEDIFMAQDPAQARGTSVTAEEILATGAERIHNNLSQRPEIQAALMGTIGRVYFSLGDYAQSSVMLEQALDLRLATLGPDDPDVAVIQNDLAETLLRVPDYRRADELLRSALATNRDVTGPLSPEVAKNLFNLAELHLKISDHDEAEKFAAESIEIYEQHAEAFGIELAEAKNMLGRILQVRGDLDRTEALLLEAIDIVTTHEGRDHPLMAYYLQNLGVLQRSKGDLEAAQRTFDRAIDATRRILGEQHHLLAATLVSQGSLLHARGDLDNAERVLRDALQLHIDTRGAHHPMVGYDMTVLGMVLHDRGALTDAETMLRDALDVYAVALDDEHQYAASALTELGAVLNSTGDLAEAEQVLKRALEIRAKDYVQDHDLMAGTRVEYADTLTRLGRYEEAEALLQMSLSSLANKPSRRLDRANEAWSRLMARTGRR